MTTDHHDLPSSKSLRVTLLLLLCAALLPLAACKKKEETAAAPAAPTEQAPATPEPPKEEPPAELKPKWPVGQRLVQRLETTADIESQSPTAQTASKQATVQVIELAFTALKEREGGGHEVAVETLAIITTNRLGTNTTVFTTRGDPKQDPKGYQPAGPLRKLVGGKVRYLTTVDGKVEKVEGGLQFRSKGAVGASPYAMATLATQFSDDAIKGWNTLHTGLPEKPVKLGDTWPFARGHSYGAATLSVDATNTFKGWEQRDGRKVALLVHDGVIAAKPPAAGSTVTATLDEGAKLTGKAWFDPALGVIVESIVTAEFGIKMSTATGQGPASKVKVVMNAKLTDAPNPGAATAETNPAAPAAETKPADAKPAAKPKAAEKP